MASPRFLEMLRCRGVDENATPYPGMVVPFGGENQIVLESFGMDVQLQHSALKVQEFDGQELTTQLLQGVRDGLSAPGTDPQQRDAFMPNMVWRNPRFFRVLGTINTGLSGTLVNVVARSTGRGRMPSTAATLEVAVVDRLVVNVAIRNVRARDAQGKMRYHAKRPCDPAAEVARMNAIWTPQTNIAFELVPSSDLDVDHNDPKTREELTTGLRPEDSSDVHRRVDGLGRQELRMVREAQGPWFAYDLLRRAQAPVWRRSRVRKRRRVPERHHEPADGVAFIADSRLPSTFAHEAGHWVGDMTHLGTDTKLLMRETAPVTRSRSSWPSTSESRLPSAVIPRVIPTRVQIKQEQGRKGEDKLALAFSLSPVLSEKRFLG